MSPHTKVVVGFDGSTGSWAAVFHAAAEAADGGTVRIVHAQLHREAYALLVPPGIVDDAPTEARRLLDRACVALRQAYPRLEVRSAVVQRGPGAALLRASRWADLLVVGRRGRGATAGGRIAAHLIAYAGCPVVVAGPDDGGTGGAGRFVVLGLDPSTPPPPLMRFAFAAARRLGTGLRICYVRRPDDGTRDDDAEGRRLMGEAIGGWRKAFADVPVALDVLPGYDPAARLLDASVEAALVVVGTREGQLSGVPGVLLRNAACPVAVVRTQHRPGWAPGPPPGLCPSGVAAGTR